MQAFFHLPSDFWHAQGGTYAGTMMPEDDLPYRLVVATDAKTGEFWGTNAPGQPFAIDHHSNQYASCPGATSQWDGRGNTAALARTGSPAALECSELTLNCCDDWYLPAQRELALIYATLAHLLPGGQYWSSTQHSQNLAWLVNLSTGGMSFNLKRWHYAVLPVRRVYFQLSETPPCEPPLWALPQA